MNYKFLAIYILLFFSACASIVVPDGGEKDIKPPVLKSSLPKNNSLLFKDKSIVLRFNEFIQIKNLENISITPQLPGKPPTIHTKGKELHITCDSLSINTTYNISIVDAIADINEGNMAERIDIAFSTGVTIDTLSVKGIASNTTIDESLSNCIAALYTYKDEEDSEMYNIPANYYSRLNERGEFVIKSVPKGLYKLLIIRDKNKNRVPDNDEEIGYIFDKIDVGSSFKIPKIYINNDQSFYKPSINTFYCNEYGVFNFIVTPKDASLKLIDNNLFTEEAYTLIFPGENEDTITWFSPMADMQDGHFDIYVNDIYFPDLTTLHMNNSSIRRKLTFYNTNINLQKPFDLFDTVKIRLSNPIYKFNKDSIEIYIDSVKQKTTDIFYFLDGEKTKLRILMDWKPETNYLFKFKKGSFVDVFNQQLDSINMSFSTSAEEVYGSAKLEVAIEPERTTLLQILDNNLSIVKVIKISRSETISIPFLKPGTYSLRLVNDKNFNQKWDRGYYRKQIAPEEVLKLTEQIVVKAGMETNIIPINLVGRLFD